MLELRPFQVREVAKLAARKRGGVAWDMGAGKTVGTATIGAQAKLRRWLIICPDNALSVWGGNPKFQDITALDWIRRWWPECTIRVEIIEGSPWNRDLIWNTPYDDKPDHIHIRIVTIDTFLRDWREVTKTGLKGKRAQTVRLNPRKNYNIPEILIFDEARRIRNKESQAFKVLDQWMGYYNPPYFYPMTGTPGHEPRHFWTMLHLIDRKMFKSYWNFVEAFHMLDDTGFGVEINEPKNLPVFHNVLGRYFSVVREEEIASERPPITRQLLEIEMDDDQRKRYKEIQDDMMSYVEADDKLILAQNEFTVITRLRQLLVCPKILSPSLSVGAAIQDFVETVEPGEPYVIFTPYVSAFEHFKVFLEPRRFRVQTLQGGIGTEERDRRIALFRQERGICVCSILYAQAFSLEPATKAFFIGYDWDPDNNRQAEKRLHRLTTVNPIASYYYTFRSTFDERIAAAVNIKQQRVNLTIPAQVRELLNASS